MLTKNVYSLKMRVCVFLFLSNYPAIKKARHNLGELFLESALTRN